MPPKKSTLPANISSHTHADTRPDIPIEEPRNVGCRVSIEIVDPWDAKNTIRAFLSGKPTDGEGSLFKDVKK